MDCVSDLWARWLKRLTEIGLMANQRLWRWVKTQGLVLSDEWLKIKYVIARSISDDPSHISDGQLCPTFQYNSDS